MAETKLSQAELMRDYISELFEQKYDFADQEKRRSAITNFLQKYKDRKFKKNSVVAEYHKQLDKFTNSKGISRTSIGKKKKIPRFKATGDMKAEISAEPQKNSHLDKNQQSKKPQLSDEELKKLTPEERDRILKKQREGALAGESASKGIVLDQDGNEVIFEKEDVAACFAGLFVPIKAAFPEIESLTDEEKDTLGRMWKRAFNKYLSENYATIVIPAMTTLGILAPKIRKARKTKAKIKEKEEAEKKVKKKTCPFCNGIFSDKELEKHKDKCDKK